LAIAACPPAPSTIFTRTLAGAVAWSRMICTDDRAGLGERILHVLLGGGEREIARKLHLHRSSK
jgi:hypothetical protein